MAQTEPVLFKPLTRDEIGQIVGLMVARLAARLAEQQIGLELSDAAVSVIADGGYDPVYGARPLARFLQRRVQTHIGRKIIEGAVQPGETVLVDADAGELVFRAEVRAERAA